MSPGQSGAGAGVRRAGAIKEPHRLLIAIGSIRFRVGTYMILHLQKVIRNLLFDDATVASPPRLPNVR
jgi:hypothetical protein